MPITPDRLADLVAPRPSRKEGARSSARHLSNGVSALAWATVMLSASRAASAFAGGHARRELAYGRRELRRAARGQRRRPRSSLAIVAGSAVVAVAAARAARAARGPSPGVGEPAE